MKGDLQFIMESMMREKNLNQEAAYNLIETSLISAYKKKYGKGLENGIVKFEKLNDSYGLFAKKDVVENDDVYSENLEIEIKYAVLINPNVKIGDKIDFEIDIDKLLQSDSK